MEDTTTTPVVEDAGVEQTQPVTETATEAVEATTAATEQQTTEEQAEPSDDDQLNTWAANKGLELDSDNAKKAARMARESEKLMHEKTRKASELEKTVSTASDEQAEQIAEQTGQDPELLKRLQRVEVKESVREFWNQDGIDRSFEPKMIELLQTKPHLAGDLDALYATAVMKSGGVAAVKSQGGRDALQSLAHKQQAAVPTGNATTKAAPKTKNFGDLSIAEMEKQLGYARR